MVKLNVLPAKAMKSPSSFRCFPPLQPLRLLAVPRITVRQKQNINAAAVAAIKTMKNSKPQNKIFPPLTVIAAITLISLVYESIINKITLHALINIALYLLAVILFYICILKIYKHYTTAFIIAFFAAIAPNFFNIFPLNHYSLLGIVIGLCSIVLYTLSDSSGLKHRQSEFYFVSSVLFYAVSMLLSFNTIVVPVILLAYELINKDDSKMVPKRLIVFAAIFVAAILLKSFGLI